MKPVRLAPVSYRIIAFLFDRLLIFGFVFFFVHIRFKTGYSGWLAELIIISAALAYFPFFHTKFGQTPGKMLLNIKVVDKDTLGNQKFGKTIIRDVFGRYISDIFMLGYLAILFDKNKQGWHDKMGNTIVIDLVGTKWLQQQGAEQVST